MSKVVIDAYAWIEYFNGTKLGEKVKEIVENEGNNIITNVITLAELASKFKRTGNDFENAKNLLLSLSSLDIINEYDAIETGNVHAEIKGKRKHFGLADACVLFTAKKIGAKVVTGDEDFRGLKEVIFLKE